MFVGFNFVLFFKENCACGCITSDNYNFNGNVWHVVTSVNNPSNCNRIKEKMFSIFIFILYSHCQLRTFVVCCCCCWCIFPIHSSSELITFQTHNTSIEARNSHFESVFVVIDMFFLLKETMKIFYCETFVFVSHLKFIE